MRESIYSMGSMTPVAFVYEHVDRAAICGHQGTLSVEWSTLKCLSCSQREVLPRTWQQTDHRPFIV